MVFTAGILQNVVEGGFLDGAKMFHCRSLSRLEDMFQSSLLTDHGWFKSSRQEVDNVL